MNFNVNVPFVVIDTLPFSKSAAHYYSKDDVTGYKGDNTKHDTFSHNIFQSNFRPINE